MKRSLFRDNKVNHPEYLILKLIQQIFFEHLVGARHSARHWADSSITVIHIISPCHPSGFITLHDDSEPHIHPQACLPWQLGEEWCGHSMKSTNICWRNEIERNPSFPQALSTWHRARNIPWSPGRQGPPKLLKASPVCGDQQFLIGWAAHTCTRGQSEQRFWNRLRAFSRVLLELFETSQ